MTSRAVRGLARATVRQVPVAAVTAVSTVVVAVVYVVASTSYEDRVLLACLALGGVVIAVSAATALDDPAEAVASAAPLGRPIRWSLRLAITAAFVSIAWLLVLASAWQEASLVQDSSAVEQLTAQTGAYLVFGWVIAACAIRRRGAGSGARAAAPAVVALHLAVATTNAAWPAWFAGPSGSARPWWIVLVLSTVVLVAALGDPISRRAPVAGR